VPDGTANSLTSNQITEWKRHLQERAADVFGAGGAPSNELPVDLRSLHAKIGKLALESWKKVFKRRSTRRDC
jgi:hypothetical protein